MLGASLGLRVEDHLVGEVHRRFDVVGSSPHHEDYRISGFAPSTAPNVRAARRLGRGQHSLLRHDDVDTLFEAFVSHAASMIRRPDSLAIRQMALVSDGSRAVLVPDEEFTVASGQTKRLLSGERTLSLASHFPIELEAGGQMLTASDPSGRQHQLAAIALFRAADEIGTSLGQMTSVLLNHSEVPASMPPEQAIELAAAISSRIPVTQFERGRGSVLRFVDQHLR